MLRALHLSIRPRHPQLGNLHRRTVPQNRLQYFLRVHLRQFFQVTLQMLQGQIRLAHHGGQHAPRPPLLLLFGNHRQLVLIRFHIRFEHIGLVRLPHVKKLPRSFRRVLRDIAQLAARLHHRLHRQRLIKRNPHSVLHAQALFICFGRRLLSFRSKNFPVQAQLTAQNHVLLHKHSLLASAVRPAANFIPAVPDRRIRPQSRLSQAPRCRLDSSLRQRHLLQLFQRQPGLGRTRCLRRSLLPSFVLLLVWCASRCRNYLRPHRRRPHRPPKNIQQQETQNCQASHHPSPVLRLYPIQTQRLTLLARTAHPRHRRPAAPAPLLAQIQNLGITLRRQHANQSHHPLHVPAPSGTQTKSLGLLHHRIDRHRRALHERILRKSRYRIRILTNVRLAHLHTRHCLRGLLRRRRRLRWHLCRHRPVRGRLRHRRSNSHPAPHTRPILRRRRAAPAHDAHAFLHPRPRHHSGTPRHRARHRRHLVHHVMWHVAMNHPISRIRRHKLHIPRLRHSHQHGVVRSPCSPRLPPTLRTSNHKLVPVHMNRMVVHPQINKSQSHPITQPHNQGCIRGPRFSIQRQPVKFHAHRIRRRIVRQQRVLLQNNREIFFHRRIVGLPRMHSEPPNHPHHFLPRHVRVIKQSPFLLQREFVNVSPARCNRVLRKPRPAVHRKRNIKTVPVHRSRFRQMVIHNNPHPLALPRLNRRPRRAAVVPPQIQNLPRKNFLPHRLRHQMKHLHPAIHLKRQIRHIRCRDRAKSRAVHRLRTGAFSIQARRRSSHRRISSGHRSRRQRPRNQSPSPNRRRPLQKIPPRPLHIPSNS